MPMPTFEQRLANYRAPMPDDAIGAFMDWRVPHGRRTEVAKCMPTYEAPLSERLLDLKLRAKALAGRAFDRLGLFLDSDAGARVSVGLIGLGFGTAVAFTLAIAAQVRGF